MTVRTGQDTDIAALVASLPLRHVAIIMDGNRRWAKARNLPAAAGHGEGVKALRRIVEHAGGVGLKALTVYAFSTENWTRGEEEVGTLMNLFVQTIAREVDALHENRVCLRFIGDFTPFSKPLQEQIHQAMARTGDNTGLRFQVALNYGSRAELVRAVRTLAEAVARGEMSPADITAGRISDALDTQGLPDPDLLIRTGGEYRLSNYLLWQCAYTELYVTDALWPEFSPERFDGAIRDYARRQRRFGR